MKHAALRNLSATGAFLWLSTGSTTMRKVNTDPLLQPKVRKRQSSANATTDTHARKDVGKTADARFKANATSKRERERGERAYPTC